ncbi:MAG: DUF6494 family protein [Gemmatimonadota bacterium]|nr:hypothetical protein [Gemmatimonadales bacterium]MDQ3139023.1 DUF6494 family protein [Gemmatimonadota bacterium]
MDEERFNLSLRKILKQFGVTAQREIEKAVDAARSSGALAGRDALQARATMVVDGLPAEIVVEGRIELN